MNIRSVTCFVNVDETLGTRTIHSAGELAATARERCPQAGFSVKTTRLATQPLNRFTFAPSQLVPFSLRFERVCSAHENEPSFLITIEAAGVNCNTWVGSR